MCTDLVGTGMGEQINQERIERNAENREQILDQLQEGHSSGIERVAKNPATLEKAANRDGEFDSIFPHTEMGTDDCVLEQNRIRHVDPINGANEAFWSQIRATCNEWPLSTNSSKCEKMKIYDAVRSAGSYNVVGA